MDGFLKLAKEQFGYGTEQVCVCVCVCVTHTGRLLFMPLVN